MNIGNSSANDIIKFYKYCSVKREDCSKCPLANNFITRTDIPVCQLLTALVNDITKTIDKKYIR